MCIYLFIFTYIHIYILYISINIYMLQHAAGEERKEAEEEVRNIIYIDIDR